MGTKPAGGLEGKAALVTGGGTGIGRACAAAMIADGAAVTICGRTESSLQDSVDRLEKVAGLGGSASYIVTDVTDDASVAAAVEASTAATGNLDIVVANAGGGGGMGPTHRQDIAEFVRVLQLNVLGTMITAKHSLPHLIKTRGSFIGMSSIAGATTHRWFGAYPVAKAGIEALIRNMADEYGPAGVRANAIRPGFISTEIMEGVPRDSAVYESYIVNTPLGDVGEPEDIGYLARFLAGDEARWITGQVINVDGGHALRRGPDFSMFVGVSDGDPRFGLEGPAD